MQAGDPPRLDITVVRVAFRVRREQEVAPVVVRHKGRVPFPIPIAGIAQRAQARLRRRFPAPRLVRR